VPPPHGLRTGKLGKTYTAMIYITRPYASMNKQKKNHLCFHLHRFILALHKAIASFLPFLFSDLPSHIGN